MNQLWRYVLIISLIVLAKCNATPEELPPIENTDLTGEWVADYSKYDYYPVIHQAQEKIFLHADGTFEQDFQTSTGYREKVSGRWRMEKTDNWNTRIYLEGASYYLLGLQYAKDTYITAWDPVINQYVSFTGGPGGAVVLYATRLLSRLDSPCGRDHDLILRHLLIGDLDVSAPVTFYNGCD